MKSFNVTNIKTSSDGAWQGDNPLNYAFPLLIAQTTVVLITSRFVAFLLKPLRQPRVIAEIVGGILLGPSVLGRQEDFFHLLFPSWSTPILESVASIGLLFFLFLVGLELDLSSILRSGKRAAGIALAGISLPFLFGAGVSVFLRKAVHGEEKVGYGQYLMFMGVALSITAFPVLARILAELKLLTTQMGQTAMAAAAFNDIAAWILLALAVAIAGDATGPLTSIWVLISGVVFVAFMLVLVRPTMNWVARRSQHDFVDEVYICITLAGVLMSGFMTDLIGIHSIFGAFVFGLTIPKGGEFAAKLIKRIEDFVSCLLLPLYFASSGLKTDVAKIRGVEAWGLLLLVISTACAGKILGTFVVAMLCMIPARESLALGVLMNTKGLVELIVLNIGKEKKVLNDEMFAILVLMALFTTFMTTPIVLVICKPLRRVASQARRLSHQQSLPESSQEEFQILACVHGPRSVPAVINLIESTRSITNTQLRLCVMHLVELTDRSSSIMMVQRARRNGVPFINGFSHGTSKDKIAAAFQTYAHVSRLTVHHSTAISALAIMHEDICQVAEDKKVEMIILPFHKQWMGEGDDAIENVGHGWRGVNQKVLETAPCTVAVLVDRGFGGSDMGEGATMTITRKRVCILFLGGADDRGTLELGSLMAEHPTVSVTVIRFLVTDQSGSTVSSSSISLSDTLEKNKNEKEMDEAALEDFKRKWNESVEYVEKEVNSITEEVKTIGQGRGFELIVVGKGSCLADHQMEHSELGLIGDILASSDHCIIPSALVIRQGKFPEPTRSQSQNSPRARKPWALNPHIRTIHKTCFATIKK